MRIDNFSKIGFILASVGGAVGLGNVWKFPYITGDNGGGAFVLFYLLAVVFIGVALLMAEILLGATGRGDTVTIYEKLAPEKTKKYWKYAGFTFLISTTIVTFYSVVIAWILHYIVVSLTTLPTSIEEAKVGFGTLLSQKTGEQILYLTLVFLVIGYVISKGIKKGIEKISNVLIPLLLIILIILLIYAMQLDGFGKSFNFMFDFNSSKFTTKSLLLAVGHAFFTLSIGMTINMIYAASSRNDINVVKTSVIITFLDTIIALVVGLIIFAIIFSAGHEASQGAGLIFITLPTAFYSMGTTGVILSIIFFVSLFFVAITSAIALTEPAVKYLIERQNKSRMSATLIVVSFAYTVGLLTLLSNTTEFSKELSFYGKSLFDIFDFTTSAIFLPISGIVVAVFVGYFVDKSILEKTLAPHIGYSMYRVWLLCLQIIVPIAILFIMLFETGLFKFLIKLISE